MRDTVWAGRVQRVVFNTGVPKRIKVVLQECGINTDHLKADELREVLRNHDDCENEKPMILQYLENKGHKALYRSFIRN